MTIWQKILYYSPFIPVIGIITHFLWIYFEYDIYSVNEPGFKGMFTMFLNGFVSAFIIDYFRTPLL